MTPRKRRYRRKQNRINFKRFYDRKKARLARKAREDYLNVTPRSSNLKDVENAETEQQHINASARVLRPRATSSPSRDPSSIVSSPCVSSIPSPSSLCPCSPRSDISAQSHVSLRIKFKKYQQQKAKEILSLRKKIIQLQNDRERYRKQLQRSIDNPKETVLVASKIKKSPKIPVSKAIDKRLRNLVKRFYEDDDNSRQCPDKKDFITKNGLKMQKRYLTDSVRNIHIKYLKSGNEPVSYVTFCRLRPFCVVKPDASSRNTCVCKIYNNMELLVS